MVLETFTTNELDFIRKMCEAAPLTGVDWVLGVSLFPPRNERERLWKERMLKGIRLVCPQALKCRNLKHATGATQSTAAGMPSSTTLHESPDIAGL